MKKTEEKQIDETLQKKIEELEKQIIQMGQEADEWKSKCMRALADYQNLERRNRDEKVEIRKFASEIVLGRLLSAIDTLGRAKDHLQDKGLDLAHKEFMAVLEEQGVEKIKTIGEQFDPHTMECIEVVEGEENKVIEELLPGYSMHGKVLRVAHVKVGKKI